MTVTKFLFLTITVLLSLSVSGQAYIDDKSFTGSWKETENGKFERVEYLDDSVKGFRITPNEELFRNVQTHNHELHSFQGIWWSFSIGHFDIQYENNVDELKIIERFEYAENENVIKRVSYEVYPLQRNSVFVGKWKLVDEKSNSIIYEKCENIESESFAFELLENGSGEIYKTNDNNERVEIEVSWWIGEEDNYVDMQFFNKMTDLINIEGFTLIPDVPQVRVERTRFDEFGE
ncbi:MAG: hypothetical protein ACFHU9_05875 [Fluviicola sp.]